jgi:hypothetical protein
MVSFPHPRRDRRESCDEIVAPRVRIAGPFKQKRTLHQASPWRTPNRAAPNISIIRGYALVADFDSGDDLYAG